MKTLEPGENVLRNVFNRWRRRSGPGANASPWPSRLVGTASGWRGGSGHAASMPTSFPPRAVAVPREHLCAKTNRLDTARLIRAFLGWLRGEREPARWPRSRRSKCRMPGNPAASPRASSVSNAYRDRMKAALAPLGIRDFNPMLNTAADRPKTCARPTASRSRPSRCLSSGATWSVGGWSCSKYGNSRPLGSSVSSRRPRQSVPTQGCFYVPLVPLGASRGTRIGEKALFMGVSSCRQPELRCFRA
jgi:hypothetical protein